MSTFTAGGSPHGASKAGSNGGGSSEGMRGADQAEAIAKFKDQYKKETGKLILHRVAGSLLADQFSAGNIVDFNYAAAKAKADRLDASSFVKEAK